MPDVLTRIRGINAATATSLQEAGILSFEKLAALTPEEVVERMGPALGISAERIQKEDWIGQAAKLHSAAQRAKPRSGNAETDETAVNPTLYAMNYMVEIFLDEAKNVHQTKVYHVQSDEGESWENWDDARLLSFFQRRPELKLAKLLLAANDIQGSKHKEHAREFATVSSSSKSMGRASHSGRGKIMGANPLLRKIEIVPAQSRIPSRACDHNQPFDVRLYLDLAEIMRIKDGAFNYTVAVLAKRLGNEPHQDFVKDCGTITRQSDSILSLKWSPLPPGTYRISAALTLSRKDTDATPQDEISASLEGGLFEVR